MSKLVPGGMGMAKAPQSACSITRADDAIPRQQIEVVGLAGDSIGTFVFDSHAVVFGLKRELQSLRPDAHHLWQRLFLLSGRELSNDELLADMAAGVKAAEEGSTIDEAQQTIVLQWLLVVDPVDIFRGQEEERHEVAKSFDAMTSSFSRRNLQRLFLDEDGLELTVPGRIEVLQRLEAFIGPYLKQCGRLQAALYAFAMEVLESDNYLPGRIVKPRREKFSGVLEWLGPGIVPHLVAWMTFLERPLSEKWLWRVERIQSHVSFARVRLAAKAALADVGGNHVQRVKELAAVHNALLRDAMMAADDDERQVLVRLANRAQEALRDIQQAAATECTVRYAAERALRRK